VHVRGYRLLQAHLRADGAANDGVRPLRQLEGGRRIVGDLCRGGRHPWQRRERGRATRLLPHDLAGEVVAAEQLGEPGPHRVGALHHGCRIAMQRRHLRLQHRDLLLQLGAGGARGARLRT
jgi:hypothetical protein